MNIFKRWRESRAQKRKLKELSAFANGVRTLDQLEQSGLLSWDSKQRRLFIEQSLALVMMKNDITWTNFIQNVYLWLYSRLCQKAWNDYFLREELKAVRDAEKHYASLTHADVERIRNARRVEILQTDMKPPRLDGFEFFIVAPPDLSHTDSTEKSSANGHQASNAPVGQLTAVGHYDPETDNMEMALWSAIEPLINKR